MSAFASVFDGMMEAMFLIGRGVKDATAGVITVKYGEQAGKAADQGMDVIGNVG